MASKRMIDQGFVRSHKLRRCSRDARLLYASLLPFLDREGRSVAEPATLKGTHLRETDFTTTEITDLLLELEGVGLIRLYASDDYAAILEYDRFLEFNKPNHKEAKSIFPKPGSKQAQPVRDELILARAMPGGMPGQDPGQGTGEAPGAAPGDSTGVAPDKRREEKSTCLTTTSSPATREAGGRLRRPPPPAVQAYLDRTTQADTTTADELAALQAKWAKAEEPISS